MKPFHPTGNPRNGDLQVADQTNQPKAAIIGQVEAARIARPWIWVIVAHVFIIAMVTTVTIVAQKYGPKEIPVQYHGR